MLAHQYLSGRMCPVCRMEGVRTQLPEKTLSQRIRNMQINKEAGEIPHEVPEALQREDKCVQNAGQLLLRTPAFEAPTSNAAEP